MLANMVMVSFLSSSSFLLYLDFDDSVAERLILCRNLVNLFMVLCQHMIVLQKV